MHKQKLFPSRATESSCMRKQARWCVCLHLSLHIPQQRTIPLHHLLVALTSAVPLFIWPPYISLYFPTFHRSLNLVSPPTNLKSCKLRKHSRANEHFAVITVYSICCQEVKNKCFFYDININTGSGCRPVQVCAAAGH